MYTGIVAGRYRLASLTSKPGLAHLVMALDDRLVEGLEIGASVALDGVCMTVTCLDGTNVSFDAMQETLRLTTLGALEPGQWLNVERSARQGAEIGGHLISGHIDGTAELLECSASENNLTLRFHLPRELRKYVFHKGFIGLHGCSLTVASLCKERGEFSVCLIPETLRVTNLGMLNPGDKVNIEVDRQTQVIVDTVERVLAERGQEAGD